MLLNRIAVSVTRCFVIAVSFVAIAAVAQSPSVMPAPAAAGVQSVTPAQYRAHLDALQKLVADCIHVETTCDASKVGDDDRIQPAAGAAYVERYGWLRSLLEKRNDKDHATRREMLPHAAQRLTEQVAELDAAPNHVDELTPAQKDARTAVLLRREFRTDRGYSLTERISAWISQQFAKLFSGVSTLGRIAPWLGTALEWGALIAGLLLMLIWIYRALDRQRVALGRLHGDVSREAALAASRVWATQAQQHAERGEWREAVHALYWASIVVLEDRRTLRRSGTRTPREALRLVDATSPLGTLLRAQTGEFERIWYGLQPADANDYQQARAQYEAMREARTQAVTPSVSTTAAVAA